MEELTEAAKAARKAYFKKYRDTHKEQLKQTKVRYWNRKAAAAGDSDQQGKEKRPVSGTNTDEA